MGQKEKSKIIIESTSKELPDDLKPVFRKAKKLEWLTLGYLITVVVVIYFTMGSSQAMKAAWLEDLISILPSVSFLIAAGIYSKKPNSEFPYGYHRIYSIAFLVGSVALLAMGTFILYDSGMALLKAEHPTIPLVSIFGYHIWMGWIMIAALSYSLFPALIIGRVKMEPSKKLHNKILFTDSEAQKADWLTAGAAILGIIGIGFGLWWADAVAALIIAIDVFKDGFTQTGTAIRDLMDRVPKEVENPKKTNPVPYEIQAFFSKLDWVKEVRVRLREHGNVFFGEVFVVPDSEEGIIKKIEDAYYEAKKIDWKVHELVITPVAGFKE